MKRLLFLLTVSSVWTATLSGPATAQEYSNGGLCQKGRKEATKPPFEAYGVHAPGLDPADAHRFFHRWRQIFYPYYAPVSPVASTKRWKPWCYFPLLPYYTPYYIGYCPKRLHNPKPRPYGSDGWGDGPMPCEDPNAIGPPPLNFGPYTSVIQDDTVFWNMGGNGLVPYGAPRPAHYGPPDLVDSIQVARAQSYGFGPGCPGSPGGAPVAAVGGDGPAILPPGESMEKRGGQVGSNVNKKTAPAESSDDKETSGEEAPPPAQ